MPDGYFGLADSDGFVAPVGEDSIIDDFCSTFRIARKKESGLSIVMPWVNADIKLNELVSAVLRGYFYPILEGALVVTVETSDESIMIDDCTITELTNRYLEKGDADLRPMLHLAKWAAFAKPEEYVTLNPTDPTRPVWVQTLLPADKIESLKTRFEAGDKIAIRAPLTVRLRWTPSVGQRIE